MARSIDSKVVQMAFENDKFEKGVSQSLSTLDKLNSSLDNLAKGNAFASLQNSIDNIGKHFTVMGQASFAIVQRLTNGIIDLGVELGKRMIMPPSLSDGFAEYELKMNSVQTILSGTGESLETVNKYLDELNHYADKTIYSFSDMTTNISKFTNTGVSLKDSVAAIQGVANAAALAGASSQQASIAMFNFSQALSSGYMDRRDWFSIEKSAMMGTVEFRSELLKTAAALGTAKDLGNGYYQILTTNNAGKTMGEVISATKNFTGALQYQWMTSKVITETLAKYSDETTELGKRAADAAQRVSTFSKMMDTIKESIVSGWARSVELVLGDFNEATEMWTLFAKIITGVIDRSASARNATLEMWRANEGRVQLISAISNAIIGVYRVLKSIKTAWENVFPPRTESILAGIAKGLNAFTNRLVISEESMERLQETFEGFFIMLRFGKTALGGMLDVFLEMAKVVLPIVGRVISIIVIGLGKFFSILQAPLVWAITTAVQALGTALQGIGMIVGGLIDTVGSFFGIFKNGTSYFASFKGVKNIFANTKTSVETLISTMRTGFNTVSDVISNAIANVREFINTWSSTGDINSKLNTTTTQFQGFGGVLRSVYSTLSSISPMLADVIFATITYVAKFLSVIGKLINIDGILSIAGTILRGFGNVVITVFGAIASTLGPVLGTFLNLLIRFKDRVSEIFSIFVNQGISAGLKALIQGFVDLGSGLKTIFATSFTKLGTFLAEFFQSLPGLVSNALVVIQDNISKLSEEFPLLGKVLAIVTTIVGALVQGIAEGFGRVGNILAKVLAYFGVMGESVEEVKTAVAGVTTAPIVQNVASFLNPLAATAAYADEVSTNVEGVATAVTGLSTSVENVGVQVSTIGKGIGDRIREFIENVDLFKVAQNTIRIVTFAIGTLIAGFILKIFISFIQFVGGLVSVFSGLGRVITSFSGALDRFGKEHLSEKLKAFALAMGLLVAALWIISKIPVPQLIKAALGVAVLAGLLVGTFFLFKKLDIEGSKEIALSLATFGMTILALAVALKIISSATSGGDNLYPVVSMIAIIATIALSLKKLQKTLAPGESSAAVTKPMLALAMSLYIIGGVVKKLGSMKPGQLAGGVAALVVAIIALTAPLALLAKMKIRSFAGVGAAFLGLAIGIRVLIGALTPLYKMDWTTFGVGLAKALIVMGALTLPLLILAKFPTKKLFSVGASFISMALALRILTGGLAFLAKQERVIETGITITMLLLSMAVALGILGAVNIAGGDIAGIAKAMASLSLSVTALAIATKFLGEVPWDSLKPMAVIFGVAIGTLAILGGLAARFPTFATGLEAVAKAFTAFGIAAIAFGAGVSLLAVGLFLLGTIGTTGLMAFTGYMVFLNGIISGEMIAKMLGVALAIGGLGYGMSFLAKGVKEITALGAKGMLTLLGIAGGIILFANALNGNIGSIVQAGVIFAGFAALIWFLGKTLDKITWQMATSFGIISLGLSAFAMAVQDNKVAIIGAIAILVALGAVLYFVGPALAMVTLPAAALVAAIGLVIAAIAGLIWVMSNVDPDILKRTFIAIGEGIVEGIIAGMFAVPVAILNGIGRIGKTIINGFKWVFGIHSPSTVMGPIGGNVILGLLNGILDKKHTAVGATKSIGNDIIGGFGEMGPKAQDQGFNVMSMFNTGLKQGSGETSEVVDGIGTTTTNSLGLMPGQTQTLGNQASQNFAYGLGSNKGLTQVNASMLTNAATGELSGGQYAGALSGELTGQGFGSAIGTEENVNLVQTNASNLGGAAVLAFEQAIKDARTAGGQLGTETGSAISDAVMDRLHETMPATATLTAEELEELREWDFQDIADWLSQSWIGDIMRLLERFGEWKIEMAMRFSNWIDDIGIAIGDNILAFGNWLVNLKERFYNWLDNLSFESFIEGLKNIPYVIGDAVNNGILWLGDKLANVFGPVANKINDMYNGFLNWWGRKTGAATFSNQMRVNRAVVMAQELKERQERIDKMFEDPLKDSSIEYYEEVIKIEKELADKRLHEQIEAYKKETEAKQKHIEEMKALGQEVVVEEEKNFQKVINIPDDFMNRKNSALTGYLSGTDETSKAYADMRQSITDSIEGLQLHLEGATGDMSSEYHMMLASIERDNEKLLESNEDVSEMAEALNDDKQGIVEKLKAAFGGPKQALEEIKTRGWKDVAKELGFDISDGITAGQSFASGVGEGMDAGLDAEEKGKQHGKSYLDGLSEAVSDLDKEWINQSIEAFNYDQALLGQRQNMINNLRLYNTQAEDCASIESELNDLYAKRSSMNLAQNTFEEIQAMNKQISEAKSRLNKAKLAEWQAVNEAKRLAEHEANMRYNRAYQEKIEELNFKRKLDKLDPVESIAKEDNDLLLAQYKNDANAKRRIQRRAWEKEHAEAKKQAIKQAQEDADMQLEAELMGEDIVETERIKGTLPHKAKETKGTEDSLSRAGDAGAKAISTGLDKGKLQVAESSKGIVDTVATTVESSTKTNQPKVKAAANKTSATIATALTSDESKAKLKTALNELLSAALTEVDSEENKSKWNKIGTNLADGLANGIRSGKVTVELAAGELAAAAKAAAEKALQEKSPSLVFARIGEMAAKGLAIGLTAVGAITNVARHAGDLVETAIDGVMNAVDSIGEGGRAIGNTLINGISEGISNTTSVMRSVGQTGAALGQEVVDGVTRGISGINDGIRNITGMVADNFNVGSVASQLSNVVDTIANAITGDLAEPVIKPVVDMSNVNAAASSLNSIFGAQSLNLSGVTANSINVASMFNAAKLAQTAQQPAEPPQPNVTNNLTVTMTNNVRGDSDIRKVTTNLDGLFKKYGYAQGGSF